MRSRIFREARRAGENTTISIGVARARAAQKIAIENVFPKRLRNKPNKKTFRRYSIEFEKAAYLGVEINTSDGHDSQFCLFWIFGASLDQSAL